MKLAVSKALKRISMVVLLCLLVVLSATACGQNNPVGDDATNNHNGTEGDTTDKVNGTNGDTTNDDVSTGVLDNFFSSMEDMEQVQTILDYYRKTENTVFLKLKITKIHDEVYVNKKDFAIQGASGIAILECSVINDLYDSGFELDQKIVLPVFLNQCFFENDSPVYKDLAIDALKSVLSNTDCIYVTTRMNTNESFIVKNDSTVEVNTKLSACNLSLYELLPSVNGKLSLNQLDTFFAEKHIENLPQSEIYGMDSFCPEGISCDMFESNVKKLSEYFDNNHNN